MDIQTTLDPKGSPASLSTPTRLILAASEEFNQYGFAGTDTNRIARRAGFAPQTFYRHFEDKIAIFVAVYRDWEEQERRVFDELAQRQADINEFVTALIQQHRAYRVFRRSLRLLSVEHPAVRQARADSRLRQLRQIMQWSEQTNVTDQHALLLLQIERLADAIVDEELNDLGVDSNLAHQTIARLIQQLTTVERPQPIPE